MFLKSKHKKIEAYNTFQTLVSEVALVGRLVGSDGENDI
jgi:hypothetical protein